MQNKPDKNLTIKCLWCNKEFHPITSNQKYCCFNCSKLGAKSRRKENRKLKKGEFTNCLYCGMKIKADKNRKFCSDLCYKLYRNKSLFIKLDKSNSLYINKYDIQLFMNERYSLEVSSIPNILIPPTTYRFLSLFLSSLYSLIKIYVVKIITAIAKTKAIISIYFTFYVFGYIYI